MFWSFLEMVNQMGLCHVVISYRLYAYKQGSVDTGWSIQRVRWGSAGGWRLKEKRSFFKDGATQITMGSTLFFFFFLYMGAPSILLRWINSQFCQRDTSSTVKLVNYMGQRIGMFVTVEIEIKDRFRANLLCSVRLKQCYLVLAWAMSRHRLRREEYGKRSKRKETNT